MSHILPANPYLYWLYKFSLFLTLFACANSSANVIELNKDDSKVPVNSGLKHIIEYGESSTIEEVLNTPDRFQNYWKPVYSEGYHGSSHWLKLTVRANNQGAPLKRLLEVNFPFLWQLNLYAVSHNRILYEAQSGSAYHPDRRPYEHSNFVFPLELPSDQDIDIYLHIINDGPISAPITFWEQEAFTTHTGLRQTGFGLYFGIMFAMAIYNFFLFISIRSPSYFWYSLHVIGIAFINISISGFGSQYLWRDFPGFGFVSAALFSLFTNYFALHFTRQFLNTKNLLPKLDKILNILGLIHLALLGIFFLVAKSTILLAFTLISTLSIIFIFSASVLAYRQGVKTARLFMIAWGIFELTIAIKLLSLTGIIPSNDFTYFAIMIGSIAEGILLALALADQINTMKDEKALADHRALRASEESNQLKDEFLATISHELRTPINGIQGSLSLLQDQPQAEEAKRIIRLAQQSCGEMHSMVADVLEFTEMQSGKLKLTSAPFSIEETFTEMVESFVDKAKIKKLDYSYELNIQSEKLIGDAARLKLVLHHLIDNAVKFTESGSIHIRVLEESGHITCSVQDTGVGISEAEQGTIFSPFTQIETGFNRRFGGLGIGLPLVQYLVKAMGGILTCQSQPSKGSDFTFSISLKRAPAEKMLVEHSTIAGDALVVEDNPVNMQILCAILAKLGLRTIQASNGLEALNICQSAEQKCLDYIFMDCQMPIMDGHEATQKIRQLKNSTLAKIPIIAITANAMSSDREKCMQSGMNDYLKKPVSEAELRRALQQWKQA